MNVQNFAIGRYRQTAEDQLAVSVARIRRRRPERPLDSRVRSAECHLDFILRPADNVLQRDVEFAAWVALVYETLWIGRLAALLTAR